MYPVEVFRQHNTCGRQVKLIRFVTLPNRFCDGAGYLGFYSKHMIHSYIVNIKRYILQEKIKRSKHCCKRLSFVQ